MKNKYQEALKRLRTNEYLTSREQREYYNLLQELVDKETPMKVIEKMYKYPDVNRTPFVKGFECPNCHQRLHTKYKRPYCAECGKKLDWGDNND